MADPTHKENRAALERVFRSAVTLDQSGQMRSTIYCHGKTIFIMNGDNTVLLKFTLPHHMGEFKNPISFKANDYEPGKFYEKDGKVYFQSGSKDSEFERTKSCRVPGLNFNDVKEIWEKLSSEPKSTFSIHKKSLSLVEDGLSHLEFQSKNKSLIITQRDIFSGTIITLTRKIQGLGAHKPDNISSDFEPVGLRTNDFISLFEFYDLIIFGITEKPGFMTLKSENMEGIIAWCLYDELGTLEVIYNGRKEQKDGGSEQSTNRPPLIRKAVPGK